MKENPVCDFSSHEKKWNDITKTEKNQFGPSERIIQRPMKENCWLCFSHNDSDVAE